MAHLGEMYHILNLLSIQKSQRTDVAAARVGAITQLRSRSATHSLAGFSSPLRESKRVALKIRTKYPTRTTFDRQENGQYYTD